MAGKKPQKSTPADRRLASNKAKTSGRVPHMPADMTHPSTSPNGMPKGSPMPGCRGGK